MNIQVKQNGTLLYEGIVEDAPEELKEINYKTAVFKSGYIELEI